MDPSKKLSPHPSLPGVPGPVVLLILDGYGLGKNDQGDCVHLANPPNLTKFWDDCEKSALYCPLRASGVAVGLPGDDDMGNSEVGHNALGCGQVVAQGAKLVTEYIANGKVFQSDNWKDVVAKGQKGTVHLFGLLSDGGIHSHIDFVKAILDGLAREGVKSARLHALSDGRDCPGGTVGKYMQDLEDHLASLKSSAGVDYRVASAGGRMYVTMDRYNSDWKIVQRGFDAMVHGRVDPAVTPEAAKEGYAGGRFQSAQEGIQAWQKCFPEESDQSYPPFVVVDEAGQPVGAVKEGDVVVNWNFRGDRAIQISQAFGDGDFTEFPRGDFNPEKVHYYGMLIYDSDKGIPARSLFPNPDIQNVLGGYLASSGVTQYACSETHKFGHVTFFFNGNRSGYIDASQELYEEVPSDPNSELPQKPEMQVAAITEKVLAALASDKWKFVRINFANGDMVGHTGLIPQTVTTIKAMDDCVGKIMESVAAKNGALIITADHGNCEEMLDKKGAPKTSHTTNLVPFGVQVQDGYAGVIKGDADKGTPPGRAGLANVAATVCTLLGLEAPAQYCPTLIEKK